MSAADAAVLDDWWRQVVADGALPAGTAPVVGRLVREVGRAELPSGPVFLKLMAFPRAKDRLRYLCRALPARHEAAMLRAVARAGVPCPEVVAVRTLRRHALPFRSLLVLRAMAVAAVDPAGTPAERLQQRAAIAAALLRAGLCHRDLNPDNFLPLADGGLALLDLQSMHRVQPGSARARRIMAARLLAEATDVPVAAARAVLAREGLADRQLEAVAARQVQRWLQGRVRRCERTSTAFRTRVLPWGREHHRRGARPPGRWVVGPADLLIRAWRGQRLAELFEHAPAQLWGIRRPWRWLPATHSVYIPERVVQAAVPQVLGSLAARCDDYRGLWRARPDCDLQELRWLRARALASQAAENDAWSWSKG